MEQSLFVNYKDDALVKLTFNKVIIDPKKGKKALSSLIVTKLGI